MSTTDRHARPVATPPLVAGQRLDRATFHARYEAMPPETRAELIGGVVHMPSPLSTDHGQESGNLITWLNSYRRGIQGLKVAADASTLLDPTSEVQPDAWLRIHEDRGGRSRVNEGGYLEGPPELVVEVSRSSRRVDLGPKREDYRRAGVLEYLVIALDPGEVFWHVLREGRYARLSRDDDGFHRSVTFPGLWLDAEALLAGDVDALLTAVERGRATPEHAAFVARLAAARRGD